MHTADDLLAGLDPEQREVATALRGPVCVVAGAGTGKTRAITHRIAYGAAIGMYKPTEVLAVTFTTRAAGEMRSRLRVLGAEGVQARTFHSAALRQARYFWPTVFGGELPELTASKIPLLREATRRCQIGADPATLRDLASEIEWAKVSNVKPADYPALSAAAGRAGGSLDANTTGQVFAAYEDVKRDRGRIDMEDILLCTAALLAEDERVAAQVRRQYRWFVVDEYQDVNPLQATLLDQWLGGRDDICVVGDPLQTIYSFAGASPEHLTSFTRRYPNASRIELVRNYRSTPQIIAAANAAFSRAKSSVGGVRLQSQQNDGEPVVFQGYSDEPAEANGIAKRIKELQLQGVPLREMSILFRINAQSEAFEEALGEHGIAYVLRGVERFFERGEVRQGIALLRGAAKAGSDADLLQEVRTILGTVGYADKAPARAGAVRDKWESLHALVSMAQDLAESNPEATLVDLVADLERRAANAQAPAAEGVTLATLHSAKGLEWDAVFCAGLHEGMVPSVHASTDKEVEEERRLFYVGITRARKYLSVTWASTRNPGGRGNRKPTRFLDPLLPKDHEALKQQRPARQRKVTRCRVCNQVLYAVADRKRGRCEDCPTTYDEDLYESLRGWRSDQATAQKLPAYCIFTDATLMAIAEEQPQDVSGLSRIAGVGKVKLDRYADDVLALLSD